MTYDCAPAKITMRKHELKHEMKERKLSMNHVTKAKVKASVKKQSQHLDI